MYLATPSAGLGAAYGEGGQIMSTVGGGLLAAAPFAGPAAPFVALAGAIVTFLGQMGVGSGCGASCVMSTAYANKAEQLLGQNIAAYFAIAAPRPKSVQMAALANFDTIWNDLKQQCSNPALGDPGRRCISDRQSGSCAYHQPAASVPPWGTPAAGQCWNWFSGYRDPIANDPNVVADATVAGVFSSIDSVAASLGLSSTSLLALSAIAVVGFVLVKS